MKPMPYLVLSAAVLGLCACNPSAGSGSGAGGSEAGGPAPASGGAVPSANPELLEALRCWGYTRASFYLHLAAPDRVGALPQASNFQMEGWHYQAIVLAHGDDMSLSEFEALRDEVTISNNDLLDEEFRDAAIAPTQTCIDTAPEIQGDVPELRQE
jgi:hypothetical protein